MVSLALKTGSLGEFRLAGVAFGGQRRDAARYCATSRRREAICSSGDSASAMPGAYSIRAIRTSPDRLRNAENRAQTTTSGLAVHAVARQSIDSRSMDNCAMVSDTTPSLACGQMNRPRSSFFAYRHMP